MSPLLSPLSYEPFYVLYSFHTSNTSYSAV